MLNKRPTYYLFGCFLLFSCRKPYQPVAVTVNYNYLVIDGVINTGTNAVTAISLTRTTRLTDTTLSNPEPGAKVVIEKENGSSIPLASMGNGRYETAALSLDPTARYRLKITTSAGGIYQSDYVAAKKTPAVDSVSWRQDSTSKDVLLYVHTHDPQNNTRYYRWDYEETYQYEAQEKTSWGLNGDHMFFIDPYPFAVNQQFDCFATKYANNIVVATSATLSQDVISYVPLTTIPKNDEKLAMRYSILVRQYGLTPEAYSYWDLLNKSTQKTGTIFDPQPSQTSGNIHCISDPKEPVIGYASASAVTEKRIFIDSTQVKDWVYKKPGNECLTRVIPPPDPSDIFYFTYYDTSFAPWYFGSGFSMVLIHKDCIDCRRRGGSNIKPGFW